ncbi:MAG: ABC transporter ATP-binding protein/permease [Vallitalea sp.]|jgi:ATP-binding cassette subfamily B protein|nr:ABC transporter ATP-binding protein/permease [Vallitalea sp.]
MKNILKNNGLKRLIEIATIKKKTVIAAIVLLVISASASFLPYISIYCIASEILATFSNTLVALNTEKIYKFIWLLIIGGIINILSYFAALCLLHKAAFEAIYKMKIDVLRHFTRLPLGFSIRMGSGNIRKILDEDIGNTEEFLAHQFPDLIYTIASCVITIVILVCVDWRYGAVCLATISIGIYILGLAFRTDSAKKHMQDVFKANAEMNNLAVEYVRGISVLKLFNTTLVTFEKFYDVIKRYTKSAIQYTLKLEKTLAAYTVLIHNIYLFMIPIIIFLGRSTNDYDVFVSKTVFYIVVAPAITVTMLKVVHLISKTFQIQYGIQNMDKVLQEPIIKPVSSEKDLINSYDIEFKNVTFNYDNNNKTPALDNVNFISKSNKVTAIVGASGSGKTTIAHLIPRFYDVQYGNIMIGGVDIRQIDLNKLMTLVGFVFQDDYLFKKSIRDNIGMGREGATGEEIIAAAKSAYCHEFITKLPQGYDTIIGSKNVHLSGGERQRISIARAILQDSPIIILDEATAFNDAENEYLIQKSFNKLLENKTVIMIAHRLNTVKNADQIIVMDKGKIVEVGVHNDLIENKEIYYSMWETYSQAQLWRIGGKGNE